MTKTVDFRADLVPFHRAVAEIIQLARQLGQPGREVLEAFYKAHGVSGFHVAGQTVLVDGVVTVLREPSPAAKALLEDLRRRVGERGAA
ncbi:hypothetical protein [Pseudogemmobacter humi]|uniref:Uncharacterized protein n=1 Tax=Pseudogemmobacter humi TaxID=2483812 RepID=A0A3P5XHQ2_9RHOB|nr:hypothetical protein [Pseudogemmobacter humi]VDC28239.1 hypothetical protein XINFAN_02015 [Pseudogemmobacter humi]